jgi:perosamine synthetase
MKRIPLMSPNITESDIDAVVKVLRSGMLVQGEQLAALEKEVGEYLGIEHVVAVSNGTATLHLALLALGIGPGDEVIVPAFSYIATANVVEIVGATCVFVDVERDTFNIDVSKIEAAITPATKAIIPVHEFGLACDISKIIQIANAHGLHVIEDAACALGATENGKFAGTFGTVGSFSLHPRKAVTSGEGGLLVTNDPELARTFRTLRNHGIDPNSDRPGTMNFVAAGFNYRMTDFQAALVRGQFSRLDEIIATRNSLAKGYFDQFRGIESIQLPTVPENKLHTWQTFHTVLDDSIARDALMRELSEAGIGANYGAQCMPHEKYYQERYSLDCAKLFPNAMRAYQSGLALPLYDKMGFEDVKSVTTALKNCTGILTANGISAG